MLTMQFILSLSLSLFLSSILPLFRLSSLPPKPHTTYTHKCIYYFSFSQYLLVAITSVLITYISIYIICAYVYIRLSYIDSS